MEKKKETFIAENDRAGKSRFLIAGGLGNAASSFFSCPDFAGETVETKNLMHFVWIWPR